MLNVMISLASSSMIAMAITKKMIVHLNVVDFPSSDSCESWFHDGCDNDVMDEEPCHPKPQTVLCYHVET